MTTEEHSHSKVKFFNLHINVLDTPEFFSELQYYLSQGRRVSINFLNAHCFNIAQKSDEYKEALEDSTFLLNDGIGVNIAGKLVGVHFKENLNGTDLIPQMLEYFAKSKLSVFCFGASEEVIKMAVQNIEADYPGLSIAGFCDGYEDDADLVIDKINESQADAVILGMGVPRQELWVAHNGDRLTSVRIFVSGGAMFDFISGNVLRAPRFVRRIKLEWLFRLVQEPIRLFSRYVLGPFVFLYYSIVRSH